MRPASAGRRRARAEQLLSRDALEILEELAERLPPEDAALARDAATAMCAELRAVEEKLMWSGHKAVSSVLNAEQERLAHHTEVYNQWIAHYKGMAETEQAKRREAEELLGELGAAGVAVQQEAAMLVMGGGSGGGGRSDGGDGGGSSGGGGVASGGGVWADASSSGGSGNGSGGGGTNTGTDTASGGGGDSNGCDDSNSGGGGSGEGGGGDALCKFAEYQALVDERMVEVAIGVEKAVKEYFEQVTRGEKAEAEAAERRDEEQMAAQAAMQQGYGVLAAAVTHA